MSQKLKQLIVCKNFRLIRKLGTGAFGQIYLAENQSNKQQKYAAKLQQTMSKFPQLYFEAKMYKYLTSFGSCVGIPRVHAITTQGSYNVMLMDALGSSLEDLFVNAGKQLSLKTVLMIGQQMIERLQFIHSRDVLHRDIKPDNFLMGVDKNKHIVYLIDFGLSKKFIKDGKHIPYKEGKELTGTARYASINTHMGIQQSRRDDLQSVGYVMLYLLRGILPWQNMKAKDTKTKYKLIMEKKISTPVQYLCQGFPNQLCTYLNYTKNLKFQEKPDYTMLKQLIVSARKKYKHQSDYVYDWSKKQVEKSKNSISKQQNYKNENMNNQLQKPKIQLKKQLPQNNLQQYLNKNNNKKQIPQNNNIKNSNNDNLIQQKIGFANKTTNSTIKNSYSKNNNNNNNNNKNNNKDTLDNLVMKISGPKISVIKK